MWISHKVIEDLLLKTGFAYRFFVVYNYNPNIKERRKMFVYKCDICKKEIKGKEIRASAPGQFANFTFCEKCGKPISQFLKKNNLRKE
ncbi:MAG: hypothetical protein AAB410_00665 [Patescibacteria group bacterium]